MTDNEIIKALECCSQNDCDNCSHSKVKPHNQNCNKFICENALDLINRQNADIEQLTSLRDAMWEDLKESRKEVSELTANIKTEAIREFAEKVKDDCEWFLGYNISRNKLIDGIVKEMTEGENG